LSKTTGSSGAGRERSSAGFPAVAREVRAQDRSRRLVAGSRELRIRRSDSAAALGAARFVQGFSSTTTWAGALAWVTVAAPASRRGEIIGTAFGAAVFGAVIGPMFGGVAEAVGLRFSFATLGVVAFAFAALALLPRSSECEPLTRGGISRAFADKRFLGGLWLNTLPALLFGTLAVLAPLALDADGWSTLAIGSVFFAAGLLEVAISPILGRASDRRGRPPIRAALAASIVVASMLAFASGGAHRHPHAAAARVSAALHARNGADLAPRRLRACAGPRVRIMNSAWALGNMTGPIAGGALASTFGDAVPYLLGAMLCALTLLASQRVVSRGVRPREA
jgi:MFS family permease